MLSAPQGLGAREGGVGLSVLGTRRGRLLVSLPTYPGGPFAAASSGLAARPARHWTAGALPPGPGSTVAPLPPGLPAVDTGRGDTAEKSQELLPPPWTGGPS